MFALFVCLVYGLVRVEIDDHADLAKEGVEMEMTIDTVKELDLNAFLGRWYQMYGSISSTLLTFGNAGPQDTCVSADYTLNEDGTTIDVLNQGIRLDGRSTSIIGKATATAEPGKRKLSFEKFVRGGEEVKAPDFEGDYWIYHVGEKEQARPDYFGADEPKVGDIAQADRYAYAIVGGPAKASWGLDKTQLFVLVRDPVNFEEKYSEEVNEWLDANGFNWWWNKARRTGSVGKWSWFKFSKGDESIHGRWGQEACSGLGLAEPSDGLADPRPTTVTGA